MNATVVLAIGGTALALMIIACVISARRARARRQRLQLWADHHGWAVQKNPSVPWARRLPGRGGRVSLLVHGTIGGRPVGVANYSYTTTTTTFRTTNSSTFSNRTSSTTTTTHNYLVTAVRTAHRYPPLAVAPRSAPSRLGRRMFGDAQTATGHPEFDRRFRVNTRHPDIGRRVIGPALITAHLAGHVPARWSLAEHDLLTWRHGSRLTEPDQIPALTGSLLRVAELLSS
jgi:hypothetical protein